MTPGSTSDVTVTDTMTCINQEEVSTGQVVSGLDLDLTESQSIGELPSQLTFRSVYVCTVYTCVLFHVVCETFHFVYFSVGEVGSGANHADGTTGIVSQTPSGISGIEADNTQLLLQVPHMKDHSSSLDDLHAIPNPASNEQTSFNLEKTMTDSPHSVDHTQLSSEHSPSTLETILSGLEIFQTTCEEDTLSSVQPLQLRTELPTASMDEYLEASLHTSNAESENDPTLTAQDIQPDLDLTAPKNLSANEEEGVDGEEIEDRLDVGSVSEGNGHVDVDLQETIIDDVVNEGQQDDGVLNDACNDQTNEHHRKRINTCNACITSFVMHYMFYR